MVDQLNDELERLRADFEKHRDFAEKEITNLNHEMPNKADKQDLIDLENRLLDKLRDMMQQIYATFATKEEVNKRLSQLNKNIREIMKLL